MKKLILVIILAAALVGITYLIPPLPGNIPGACKIEDGVIVKPGYVKYCGENGKNAFESLRYVTAVEYKQYSFGVFVESINTEKPDSKHFWKLYVNGQESQVGADQVQTKNGDVIEWKMELINL